MRPLRVLVLCLVPLVAAACGGDTQATVWPDLEAPDLATPPDLTTPDLARPPDLASPPDLSPVDSFLYSFYFEFSNDKCPTTPNKPGSKAAGESCTKGEECKGTCCNCTISSRSYYGAVCLNSKCAQASEVCPITNARPDVQTQACAP